MNRILVYTDIGYHKYSRYEKKGFTRNN